MYAYSIPYPFYYCLLLEKNSYHLTVYIHFQTTICFKKMSRSMEIFPMAQDCVIAVLQIPLINTSLVFLNSKMPSFWQIQYVVMSQHYDKPYREDTAGSESFHIPSTASMKGMFTWPTEQGLNICSSFAVNSLNSLAEQAACDQQNSTGLVTVLVLTFSCLVSCFGHLLCSIKWLQKGGWEVLFGLFDPLRNVNISLSFCLYWLRTDEKREGNLGYQANENE